MSGGMRVFFSSARFLIAGGWLQYALKRQQLEGRALSGKGSSADIDAHLNGVLSRGRGSAIGKTPIPGKGAAGGGKLLGPGGGLIG